MILEFKSESTVPPAREIDLPGMHSAGRRLAESITVVLPHGKRGHRPRRGQAERILARALDTPEKSRAWLLDNARLLQTAAKQAFGFAAGLHEFPVALTASGKFSRVRLVAQTYLEHARFLFTEESCAAFLNGFQEVAALEMGELWGLNPTLQLVLLDTIENASPKQWPRLVMSVRHAGETAWKDLFESVSLVDRALDADPANTYGRMDFESRDRYRNAVSALAKHSLLTELEVAEAAVGLACEALPAAGSSRAAMRRSHVGYYLIDDGLRQLRSRIEFRMPLCDRFKETALSHPAAFYLIGIELLTFCTVALLVSQLGERTPLLFGLLLLLLPATQTAVDFVNHLVTFLVRPRVLSKLDFSKGVPAECATMVAVPSLLLNEAQIRDLVLDLEIRFLANRGANVYFALLTDAPDSDRPDNEPEDLVNLCKGLIDGLNRRYPEAPFFLFHRHRTYNDSEQRWMGWERKRGKLLDLNQLLRGSFDAFPVKTGRLDALGGIRYVITVDSDTQLPRNAAAKLIGTIAHPLNAAVVDSALQIVVEGYGILQPRIGISIHSASRSRLAALYSGETGFDIYTRAVSDVYQDLFAEAIFTGKGIYEVDVMHAVLQRRFPENALLSHDLIEGAYARVGLVSDIELIDDYPSHFSAYNRRKHRWTRGDWQILRWIFNRVPDYSRNLASNPISLISRWKILDNLRRSLLDPGILLLLLGGWFALPGTPAYWTTVAVAVLLLPVYCDLLFALLRIPRGWHALSAWAGNTGRGFANGHATALFGLIFLLHQTLLSIDAVTRSTLRVFVTRRRLLEWETAAEAEAAARSKSTVDLYLEWTPWISMLLGGLLWLLRPAALPVAAPVLVLWVGSRSISAWLNRAPRLMNHFLEIEDTEWLCGHAERICRYFQEWSSSATNWLIPDSVREDGAIDLRLSPTNLGLLLNARIAALHFGVISLREFISATRHTLGSVTALQKHRGHLLNWYDVSSMKPLEPLFISTVDSGNLVAALWTLKQASLALAREPRVNHGLTTEMAAELSEIASISDGLVREMDFGFLYNSRKKLLSVGYDVSAGRPESGHYDLLASEARTAVFVAIAKGDIPQEAWFHLGRAHTLAHGDRVLLSWTGTMFEYLMPALWMHHYPGTIMEQSMQAAVRVQRQHCSHKGVPWGISECACQSASGGKHGYAAFGIPALSLKRQNGDSTVIAPYATLLALMVSPADALKNLRQMEDYGWSGRYGFYEAIEYTSRGGEVIRSWMAHHEGMALLAICNLLFDNPMRRYFHAEPQVLATELLLNERLPAAVVAEAALEPVVPPDIPALT
jgi:cyclic beta-1,2-glucan synthetase